MTTKEKIEVMQAYEEGKTIECNNKRDSDWFELDQPDWNWSGYDYRLKKEKRPLTREEITAQWVKDNDVKVGDRIRVKVDGPFLFKGAIYDVKEIKGYCIACEGYAEEREFNVEDIEKVTLRVVQFSFEDREVFRDKWVRNKGCSPELKIIAIDSKGVVLGYADKTCHKTYEEMITYFEFTDSKPFGKEVWE